MAPCTGIHVRRGGQKAEVVSPKQKWFWKSLALFLYNKCGVTLIPRLAEDPPMGDRKAAPWARSPRAALVGSCLPLGLSPGASLVGELRPYWRFIRGKNSPE